MKTVHKAFSSVVTLSPDDGRTLIATVTTSAVDRDGEVVIPLGMRSKNFEGNPIVFFDHAWSKYGVAAEEKLPIGKVTASSKGEDSIEMKVRFTERPPTHPDGKEWLPDTLLHLYADGAMSAWSIGFDPVERRAPTKRDIEKYGEDCRLVTSKWDMVELSAVTLGCNQEALTTAVSKGLASQEFADEVKAEKAKSEEKPEMGACKGCDKQFPVEDMTESDGDFYCDECLESLDDEGDDDTLKGANGEETEKQVIAAVELREASDDPPVRYVCRNIDAATSPRKSVASRDAVVRKMVVRQIKKMRGSAFSD